MPKDSHRKSLPTPKITPYTRPSTSSLSASDDAKDDTVDLNVRELGEAYCSNEYSDDKFDYRHVHVPPHWVKSMPEDRTMTEQEWRDLGELIYAG